MDQVRLTGPKVSKTSKNNTQAHSSWRNSHKISLGAVVEVEWRRLSGQGNFTSKSRTYRFQRVPFLRVAICRKWVLVSVEIWLPLRDAYHGSTHQLSQCRGKKWVESNHLKSWLRSKKLQTPQLSKGNSLSSFKMTSRNIYTSLVRKRSSICHLVQRKKKNIEEQTLAPLS